MRLLSAVVLLALATAACSSSSNNSASNSSCTIPSGTYTFKNTASGGPDCMSGTYTATWPPSVPTKDAGKVTQTCTTTTSNGKCQATCSGGNGSTTVTTYSLTSTGFSGTTTSPVSTADGGTYTCTYNFTATKN